MSRRVLALLVAVVIAAAAVAWLATRSEPDAVRPAVDDAAAHTAGSVPAAPDGALQAVSDLLPTALSYDHSTLDADLAEATAAMTEAFAKEYADTFDATVRPLATSRKAISEAHVRATGLIRSADAGQALVLAYVDQVLVSSGSSGSSESSGGEEPVRVSQTRVLVSVKSVDGTWLLDSIDPL
ncbi:hypothetical protein ASE01_14425 [Nocardioides sp. Root190]|uniref:hypothetical protein n=1 Tax=Nocardioides sp. Root190 TaxID=1736488 RepID=UPI0006F3529F|nr:hypothetical protein [Nocardioides sp. Root190]KRB76208.1 hypothetical protein ASE01_14425 [Nocardioides sp. Root190]